MGPFQRGEIDRERYKAAGEAATQGLYERVKAGEVQLGDLLAAAAVTAAAGTGGAGVAAAEGREGGVDGGRDGVVVAAAAQASLRVAEVSHVLDLLLSEAGVPLS